MKKEYRDNQEYFNDVLSLQEELETEGKSSAAQEILEGVGLINGLTDGWAMFLDSLNKVQSDFESSLSAVQQERLRSFINIAHKVVRRE